MSERPQPPNLEAFGLSAKRVAFFKSEPNTAFGWLAGILGILAVFCFFIGGAIAVGNGRKQPGDPGGLVLCLLGILPLGFAFIALKIDERLKPYLQRRRRQLSDFAAFERYLHAEKQYQDALEALHETERQRLATAEHQRRLKEQFWLDLDGWAFEQELARHFRSLGWNARATRGSRDGGIDIVLQSSARHVIVQCKAHSKPIAPAAVRDLYGALRHDQRSTEAWLVTTRGFSPGATTFARGKPIRLLTIREIIELPDSVRP